MKNYSEWVDIRCLLFSLVLTIFAASAFAQQSELLGYVWSANCSDPGGDVVRFIAADARTITHKIYFKGGQRLSHPLSVVVKVEELGEGRVRLTYDGSSGGSQGSTETFLVTNGEYRILSRRIGDKYFVAGGQFLENNQLTPKVSRCSPTAPAFVANRAIAASASELTSVPASYQGRSAQNESTRPTVPGSGQIGYAEVAEKPRGVRSFSEDDDGANCDPGIDPDQWFLCKVYPANRHRYRLELKSRVNRRIIRADEIAPCWNTCILTFKNGVLISAGERDKETKVDPEKYNAIEKLRLAGDFLRANRLDAEEVARETRADAERAQRRSEEMEYERRQCKGRPQLLPEALESLSNKFGVNPNQIELNRVEFHSSCYAVIRHPRGTSNCSLRFNSSGRVSWIGACSN